MRVSLRVLALIIPLGIACSASAIEDSLSTQMKADDKAKESQQRIDALSDEIANDLQRFRASSQRLESLSIYNAQLRRLIASQEGEVASLKRQTQEIDGIETGALPLMIEMTAMLDEVIALDVPFLVPEREERVAKLKELIDRADVTAGEKFRRIMEAYLVELDFGRTIEAYRGELNMNSTVRNVDFLRIGRIGLYYQTLDGAESGRWNPKKGAYEVLDSGARGQIQTGLRIARKQAPPVLLSLPVEAPGAAR